MGLKNFVKNREPAGVAAFLLALMQGVYVVAAQFGHAFTIEQWSSITALAALVAGFAVRGNVTSNATLAATTTPKAGPTTPPAAP